MNQEAEFSTSGVTPFQDSLEDMADMDELFGSDGDSDNDQRGNDHFISYNNIYGVSGYVITLIFLVQIKFVWFSRTFLLAFRETRVYGFCLPFPGLFCMGGVTYNHILL